MRSCGAQEGHPHPVWGLERPQFPLSPLTPQALTLLVSEAATWSLGGARDLRVRQKDIEDEGSANVPAS